MGSASQATSPTQTPSRGAKRSPTHATQARAVRTRNASGTVITPTASAHRATRATPSSSKKGECEYDHDCDHQLACFDFKCRDPCIGTCGQLAECQVRDHRPICSCPQGYTGDPLTACKRRTVVGAKQSRPNTEPRSVIVIGQQYSADGSSREVQQTIAARGGGGRSFNRGSSRSVAVIGAGAKKRRFLRLINSLTRDE